MCGIAGLVGDLAAEPGRGEAIVRAMTDAIEHRGPDGGAVWRDSDGLAVLGHRRLAIIDLTPTGDQPMTTDDKFYSLVFNGELYNFRELRTELEATGFRFKGTGDTEVLLAAIVAWGIERALQRANGMFAFALWDSRMKCLWLARDRFGEKPLYWSKIGDSVAFGSELKALRPVPGFDATVDRSTLAGFMTFGVAVPPGTIYVNTHQVEPGTLVRVSLVDRHPAITTTRYWSPHDVALAAMEAPFRGTLVDATDQLHETLGRAVAMRMVSDVPLGAFLSGGIDSSLVVSLMQQHSTGPVKTFTIGFVEEHMSEAEHARSVAGHLGLDHTVLMLTGREALDIVPTIPDLYDEPFADSSQIPTVLVSKLARQHVTVALSGDGGDELFGGYTRYYVGGRLWSKLSRIPAPIRGAAGRSALRLSPTAWDRLARPARRVGLLKNFSGGVGDRLHKAAGVVASGGRQELYGHLVSHWRSPIVVGAPPWPGPRLDTRKIPTFVEQMMLCDTETYLPNDILTKVDRAAMSVSLETRVPLLDPDVYAFAWSLPLEMRASPAAGKLVMRELLARFVPRPLFERPKMGFGIPLDSWLRGPLKEWAGDLLSTESLTSHGLLDPAPIRESWEQHQSGQRNWQYQLWDVLVFQAWYQRWHHG